MGWNLKKKLKRAAKRLEKNTKRAARRLEKNTKRVIKKVGDGAEDALDLYIKASGVDAALGEVEDALKPETPKIPDLPDVELDPGAREAIIGEEEELAPELGGKGSEKDRMMRRKGRKALRIELRTGNSGAGGTGLNIPGA